MSYDWPPYLGKVADGLEGTAQVDPLKSDAPTGEELAEVKPKKKRRPHTPAAVRGVRAKMISREEFETIVSTLETIAHRSDSQQSPEAGNCDRNTDSTKNRKLTK